MQQLQPGDLLVGVSCGAGTEKQYAVMTYNDQVIRLTPDGLLNAKVNHDDCPLETLTFGFVASWKSIGSYGQEAANRAEDAHHNHSGDWVFDAQSCNSEHFARAMTERWRECTHYDKYYDAIFGLPDENWVQVQLGDVPPGWAVDIYTYKADDPYQWISYQHEWLHHGVKCVSAGQQRKEGFRVMFYGGTSVNDGRWQCLTGTHTCRAGDTLEVFYNGQWNVEHCRKGKTLYVRQGNPDSILDSDIKAPAQEKPVQQEPVQQKLPEQRSVQETCENNTANRVRFRF